MTARVEAFFEATPQPTSEEISAAFWQACSGAQRRTAEYLLKRGAAINFVPYYAKVTPLEAASGLDTRRSTMVTWLREQGAERSSSG